MSDLSEQLANIRKAKHFEYNGVSIKKEPENVVYNYDERKQVLSFLRQVANWDTFRENMNKVEKDRYKLYMSFLKIDDLEHIRIEDFTSNYINDLYKYCPNYHVLRQAYIKWNNLPTLQMIKELFIKTNIDFIFIKELIIDYLKDDKDPIQLIISTNLLNCKNDEIITYVMTKFYDEKNMYYISFKQLDYIYNNSEITPDKFCFLVKRCSDKECYTKCTKTYGERMNRNIIKDYKNDLEKKYKCLINIDLFN